MNVASICRRTLRTRLFHRASPAAQQRLAELLADRAKGDGVDGAAVDRLQARYGFAKSEAEREIEAWMKAQRHAA